MAEVVKAKNQKISKEEANAAGITTSGDGIALSGDTLVVSSNPEPTVKQPEQENRFVADRALHLTKDGKVVEEDDPAGVKVLIGKGGSLSAEEAEKYGLTSEGEVEAQGAEEDLETLKKAELLEIAEEKGVDAKQSMTKAEIIDLIEGE